MKKWNNILDIYTFEKKRIIKKKGINGATSVICIVF